MKAGRKLLAMVLALAVGALAAGCGGAASSKTLTLGDIGWDESVAVANLTKVLLEQELDYDNIQIQTLDVGPLFQGVGTGDLAAFQDVWLPNHQNQVDEVQDTTELLDPWYQGTTEFGIAVPYYMDITTIPQLNQTNVTQILGIEPGAVISERIPNETIPTYDLKQEYVQASTPAMLAEVDNRYSNGGNFAFIAWSPHWMNQRYDFHYLEDPQDTLGELNDPSRITTIVHEDVSSEDPVAYAFMKALTLTEEQINGLEDSINKAENPEEGARTWAENNRDVVQPWIDAAKQAQES